MPATGDRVETAIRRLPGGRACARSGRAASADSITAASSTFVASGPFSARPYQEDTPSADGTTPGPGLSPRIPQDAAGIRIEPMPSAPSAIGAMAAATAAALPPEEPPAVRRRFQGLRVTPNALSVVPQMQSSGTRVMPMTIAPADRNRL